MHAAPNLLSKWLYKIHTKTVQKDQVEFYIKVTYRYIDNDKYHIRNSNLERLVLEASIEDRWDILSHDKNTETYLKLNEKIVNRIEPNRRQKN